MNLLQSKKSISYQKLFRFGQENGIFQYQLMPVYCFEIIVIYIYIYIYIFVLFMQIKILLIFIFVNIKFKIHIFYKHSY